MKKYMCVLLSVILLLTVNTFKCEYHALETSFLNTGICKGDLNNDGNIDTADLAYIKLYLSGGIEVPDLLADVSNDGLVDTFDLAIFKLFLAGVGEDFNSQTPIVGYYNENSNAFVLNGNLPIDIYTLRYEDTSGIMEGYSEICRLQIEGTGENAVYSGFIDKNCAPVGAITVGVYNSQLEKVGNIDLGSLETSNLGEKLYSVGVLSDSHVGAATGEADLIAALQYFENEEDIEFTAICGDLTHKGNDEQLTKWKEITDTYSSTPVYGISGNHEAAGPFGPLSMAVLRPYTGQDLYYSFTFCNDVYIMVGMHQTHQLNTPFAEGELQWLYETLEANKNKNCFVFMHLFPWDGSGDAVNCYGEDYLDNTADCEAFYSLMKHYKNVTWFHGHSHAKFKLQEVNSMNNYDDKYASHSVHIPSIASPTNISADGTSYSKDYSGSEGYVMDVYENKIILRGRDFISGKFLPIASYLLDISIKDVEENSYFDTTGTILNCNTNTLKSGNSWYAGSIDKSAITEISFVNGYNPINCDESWDVTINNSGEVKAYRNGTKLTIAGGKNGISLNSNSNSLFEGFSSVIKINGLENLYTSNLTFEFKNAFKNCNSLEEIDISTFDLSGVRRIDNLFTNCSSLKSVKLPDNLAKNSASTVYITAMFQGCSSLENVDLSMLEDKYLYFSSVFYECSNLKSVKLGKVHITTAVNAFYRCGSIQEIDMSNFNFASCNSMLNMFYGCSSLSILKLPSTIDTSKVTSMKNTFRGCSSLSLDCSGWDTESCTDITDFNYKAPSVIAPVIN